MTWKTQVEYDLTAPAHFTPAERKAITWAWCQYAARKPKSIEFQLVNLLMFLASGLTLGRAIQILSLPDKTIILAFELLENLEKKMLTDPQHLVE